MDEEKKLVFLERSQRANETTEETVQRLIEVLDSIGVRVDRGGGANDEDA